MCCNSGKREDNVLSGTLCSYSWATVRTAKISWQLDTMQWQADDGKDENGIRSLVDQFLSLQVEGARKSPCVIATGLSALKAL